MSNKKKEQRYRCITCNETFTVKQGKKPRCPSCMSIHSVEPVTEAAGIALPPWWKHAVIALAVAGAAVGGYFLYVYASRGEAPLAADPGSIGAVDPATLHDYLLEQQIEDENAVDPFASGEDLATFVEKHRGLGSGVKLADRLYAALIDFKSKGAYQAFVPRQARKTPWMDAGRTFEAMQGKDRPELYSLELAVLFTRAARLAGLAAVVAEVVSYGKTHAPLDPSGNLGHFASLVYPGGAYEGEAHIYDLHQGRHQPVGDAEVRPLTDAQVVAHVLDHEAVRIVSVKFDPKAALVKLEDAMILAPDTVQFHTLKALIYVTGGGIEEGKEELRKAMQIRTDAQRLVKWGAIQLAEDEAEDAMTAIRKAIDLEPDYALAHASLAMALLAEGEEEEAGHELSLAKEKDPDDPLIPVYEANYYMARGEPDKALKAAERAYEENYHDPQTGLLLASICGQTGHVDRMRKVLQEIRSNEELPGELLAFIDQQLGQVTMGVEEDDEEDEEDEEIDSSGIDLGMPEIGEKPSEGFLTGGHGSGLSLTPGSDPFGLNLKKGGGLLSGGGN
jgi:Tfp pilus assembly protein PilF